MATLRIRRADRRVALLLVLCMAGLLAPPVIVCAQDDLVEVGDAPSSWNASGTPMTAYPWLGPGSANFPVVVYPWAPASPDGYGICNLPGPSYLGTDKSLEMDADRLPDDDGMTNISPTSDRANRDELDDGVTFPSVMPHCGSATIAVTGFAAGDYYVNAWVDWNRDGDWNDGLVCPCGGDEWAVRDFPVGPGAFSTPISVVPCHPGADIDPASARVTLSPESSAVMGDEWAHGAIWWWEGCPTDGETEDYYVELEPEFVPEWGSIALLGSGLISAAGYASLRLRRT